MKTIIVYSGGMDSTTLLYQLIAEKKAAFMAGLSNNEVKAISFNYGQRHVRELEQAKKTCEKLGIEHKVIDMAFMRDIASNSSLTGDIATPHGHYEAENMKLTVVPNRNMIMASIAIGWAVNLDFDQVALGVHAGDHAIYPDCRPEFILALSMIAKVANFKPIDIYTPFLNIDKGDIAIKGKELGVDYSLSHTCYEGTEVPCGKCGACQERAEAFKKAGITDPLLDEKVHI
jgi:7-cyano-7-deazaguanine synthase